MQKALARFIWLYPCIKTRHYQAAYVFDKWRFSFAALARTLEMKEARSATCVEIAFWCDVAAPIRSTKILLAVPPKVSKLQR